jgi:aryl-alcohol dehydrogenase-like predicted oxidoreductase
MNMTDYRPFGRSGLIVSPLALGTMTFGAGRWGTDEPTARAIFDTYVDAGGNLIDTADVYSGGESEKMLGRFLKDSGIRDRLVVSTKAGFSRSEGTPMHAGNGAYNIRLGIEGSLKRLGVDRIDLYWVHVWDQLTPAEEVLRTLSDAVARGDILYYGFSNAPSWYVAKIATLARAHGLPGPIGLQYAWSLVERGVELDILPMAREFGLGMMPWSPLGGGLLTGKYGRDKLAAVSEGATVPNAADGAEDQPRERLNGANPYGGMLFTERNFDIVDTARAVADALDVPMVHGRACLGAAATRRNVAPTGGEQARATERESCRPVARIHRRSFGSPERRERPARTEPLLHLRPAAHDALRRYAGGLTKLSHDLWVRRHARPQTEHSGGAPPGQPTGKAAHRWRLRFVRWPSKVIAASGYRHAKKAARAAPTRSSFRTS